MSIACLPVLYCARPTRRKGIRDVGPTILRAFQSWIPARLRHAVPIRECGADMIIEVWSCEEYEALPTALRPETAYILPGIGWAAIRRVDAPEEFEDIRKAAQEESDRRWRNRKGQ